jgi:hypothetical protein
VIDAWVACTDVQEVDFIGVDTPLPGLESGPTRNTPGC